MAFAGLLVWAWVRARRVGDLRGQAGLLWAGLAPLVALLVGIAIHVFIDRPRPYAALPHIEVLVARTTDGSFPSDHSLAVGAVAAGIWLVDRTVGGVAFVLAILMAVTRVYAGAHYPSDVVAGLLISAAVAVAGARLVRPPVERLLGSVSRVPLVALLAGRATGHRQTAPDGHVRVGP
ncbi:phosphatase PAP2 family protein [Aquihabitans sp. G128]|uniref:phosphatase PAP2 family protein n=1 Tax=Aquihabitans sp. G128 TaxID=2849779 RepID=UPI00352D3CB3